MDFRDAGWGGAVSIDAKIRSFEFDEDTLVLFLEPRYDGRVAHFQIPGQARLRIEKVKWLPEPGMVVWGNAGEVVIGSGAAEHHYERIGLITLREKTSA